MTAVRSLKLRARHTVGPPVQTFCISATLKSFRWGLQVVQIYLHDLLNPRYPAFALRSQFEMIKSYFKYIWQIDVPFPSFNQRIRKVFAQIKFPEAVVICKY